jgi:hypothetical protein
MAFEHFPGTKEGVTRRQIALRTRRSANKAEVQLSWLTSPERLVRANLCCWSDSGVAAGRDREAALGEGGGL